MVDRLSYLPDNVIDQILSSIPIGDAVKTSLLSTQWRNTWKSISDLSFVMWHPPKVDKILELHCGRIRKFCVHSTTIEDFAKWTLYLSDHPIEDLVINTEVSATSWTIPSSAFLSWKNLTRLELTHCHLTLPSAFRGFKCLNTLKLSEVTITRESLQNLISGSPALETLILKLCQGIIGGGFDVDAPSLKSFRLNLKCYVAVRLISCPALEEWSFKLWVKDTLFLKKFITEELDSVRGYNLLNLLSGSPRLQSLSINDVTLVYLGSGVMPRELPTRFEDLHILSISACYWSIKHVTALYQLLSSAPNIQELTIKWPEKNYSIDTSNTQQWDMKFPRLKNILVRGFGGLPEDIRFVERMLSASPNLHDVELIACKGMSHSRKFELMRRFMQFERPSRNALTIVTDPFPY